MLYGIFISLISSSLLSHEVALAAEFPIGVLFTLFPPEIVFNYVIKI